MITLCKGIAISQTSLEKAVCSQQHLHSYRMATLLLKAFLEDSEKQLSAQNVLSLYKYLSMPGPQAISPLLFILVHVHTCFLSLFLLQASKDTCYPALTFRDPLDKAPK